MSELKVGISGYGVVGKRRKDCVDAHPNLRVVAVCDRVFKEEGKFLDGIRYYQNSRRLLEEKLDVLIVATGSRAKNFGRI